MWSLMLCGVTGHTQGGGATLPGGVHPADGRPGGDMVPVQQESGRDGAAHQRQDPEVSPGGQDPGEAAGHVAGFQRRLIPTVAGRKDGRRE